MELSLPANSSKPARLASDRSEINVTLPASNKASKSVIGADGLPTFDNRDGSSTTAVPKLDGSLQIVTTIESATAPMECTYALSLAPGSTLRELNKGSIAILASDGTTFLGCFGTLLHLIATASSTN